MSLPLFTAASPSHSTVCLGTVQPTALLECELRTLRRIALWVRYFDREQ
jgi:hypothetical protein